MKRISVLLLLMVLTVTLSAERIFIADHIADLNGSDWVEWPRVTKINFIIGYWAAIVCMEEIYFTKVENKPADIAGFVEIPDNRFEIKSTVGDWVDEIDRFYKGYLVDHHPIDDKLSAQLLQQARRDFKLWFVAALTVRSDWFEMDGPIG